MTREKCFRCKDAAAAGGRALPGTETMRESWSALMVCLLSVATAHAQVPRDPFAEPGQSPSAASAPSAADKSAPAPFVTRQRDVEIPFSVRAGSTPETQPASVRVFVTWDRGQNWHLYDERRPEDGRFRFKCKQDGEFWFATQTIDRAGRPDSPEPRKPQLRLIVDSQRPQLQVHTQVHESGEVAFSWNTVDTTLNAATLKFEYQDAVASGPWESVPVTAKSDPVTGQSQGQSSFRPVANGRSINLRAEVSDAAGNVAFFSQRLSLSPASGAPAGGLAYAPPADPSATRWPSDKDPASGPQSNQWVASNDLQPSAGGASEQVRIPSMIDNPFAKTGRLASSPQTSVSQPSTSQTSSSQPSPPAQEDVLPPPATTQQEPSVDSASEPTYSSASTEEEQPQARDLPSDVGPLPRQDEGYAGQDPSVGEEPSMPEFGTGPETMPTPQPHAARPEESVDAPLGQRPRLTNSRRFSLDYDVEAVGPEGVSAVELWGTSDGGRSWAKWGLDPDRASPFDVEVNNESSYGFRIVIVGKSGLATSAPQAGDAADIWVGIDATRPTAKLTGAAYGQGEAAGKLEIRWEASDANLGPRPISLAISDRPDGQFTPIAAGLPNIGQYAWEFDPRSPRQIYLRLEVRDEAGNIAIDQLSEPIKVEGLEPKGRIRGFNPAPESSREAFRSPLFQ
jgi:hypothetical protein